mgnify:CR=1 FL=1
MQLIDLKPESQKKESAPKMLSHHMEHFPNHY